jgi:hypothetical protein
MNTTDILYRCLPFYDVVLHTEIMCNRCQSGYEDECATATKISCPSVSSFVTPNPCELLLRLEQPHCVQATTYEQTETKKGARRYTAR